MPNRLIPSESHYSRNRYPDNKKNFPEKIFEKVVIKKIEKMCSIKIFNNKKLVFSNFLDNKILPEYKEIYEKFFEHNGNFEEKLELSKNDKKYCSEISFNNKNSLPIEITIKKHFGEKFLKEIKNNDCYFKNNEFFNFVKIRLSNTYFKNSKLTREIRIFGLRYKNKFEIILLDHYHLGVRSKENMDKDINSKIYYNLCQKSVILDLINLKLFKE